MMRALLTICVVLLIGPIDIIAQTAPNFSVTDVEGNRHSLYEDYLSQNKYVLLFLMHSKNPESNALAYDLQVLYSDWGSGLYDVQFMGLTNRDWDTDNNLKKFNSMYRVKFPMVSFEGGSLDAVEAFMGEDYFLPPVFILINPDTTMIFDIKGDDIWASLDLIEAELEASNAIKPFVVKGEIFTDELPVSGVDIDIKGAENTISFANESSTDEYGYYEYSFLHRPESNQVEFIPVKNNDFTNGISTLDMVSIYKHLLGSTPFTNPYDHVRADIDRSGTISGLDIVALRKLILRIDSVFPNNNTSWRFIPRDYVFDTPEKPLKSTIPESVTIADIDNHIIAPDFIGLKIGDFNGSADPNKLSGTQVRNELEKKLLIHQHHDQNLVSFDIEIPNLSSVSGMQFALSYDPESLTFQSIEDGLLTLNNELLGSFHVVEPGAILFSLIAPDGVSRINDETLFSVVFQKSFGQNFNIELAEELLNPEVYDENNISYQLSLHGITTNQEKHASIKELKVFPNPTMESFTIQMDEPFSGTINLYGINGQLILTNIVDHITTNTLNISYLPPGVYSLILDDGLSISSKNKIIKD